MRNSSISGKTLIQDCLKLRMLCRGWLGLRILIFNFIFIYIDEMIKESIIIQISGLLSPNLKTKKGGIL
jgi:hypothetical protein